MRDFTPSFPCVDVFQRLVSHALAVGVKEHFVAKNTKVNLLPFAAFVGENLGKRRQLFLPLVDPLGIIEFIAGNAADSDE